MTPPPGWYRDPSHPLVERWWDGTTWTEHRRSAGAPQQPVTPGEPLAPGDVLAQAGFGPQPSGPGSGRAKLIALAAAGIVLVASIVTGALLLGRTGGAADPTAQTTPTPLLPSRTVSGDPASPSAPASGPPADDPAVVTDELNGITFPLLDGWIRPRNIAEDDVVMTTDGTYDCPGDPGICRRGRVISRTVTANDEKAPEALAKGDIQEAAEEAYDRDVVDGRPYHGITSHRLVAQGQVAVAGRAGYYVRWRVRTEAGPGGYVQSLAFPSSVGSESPIIVRYAFDAGTDGPPPADMDRITRGIRAIGDADTGAGVGSSIGPAP